MGTWDTTAPERIEQQPELVVHVVALDAGEYVEYGVARAGEPLPLPAPFATVVVPTLPG